MSSAITLDFDSLDSISLLLSADAVLEDEPDASSADPLLGSLVAGRYRVLGLIGRGGMGAVYEVEHVAIGKLLAMKVLAGPLADHPTVLRRFRLEALAASRLESVHTVQVLDYGVSDGRSFLIMERVSGASMSTVVSREGAMRERRVARIAIQICKALAEAHAKNVVHRDIKPDNVMLTLGPDGEELAKVLDFGLAKVREVQGACDVTTRGTILGTPYYMAPEQILGDDEVDGRADVYGLGALMYRALTGAYLFTGKAADVLAQQLTMEPAPLQSHPRAARVSDAMTRVVMDALVKNVAERTPSIEELRARLEAALATLPEEDASAELDAELAFNLEGPDSRRGDAPTQRLGTRDDLDAYEQELRRQRYGWIVFGIAFLLVLAAAVVMAYGPVRGAM